MTKDPKDPKDKKDPEKAAEQKKGGFGAFADQYRDRWAANHPSKKEGSRSTPAPDGSSTKPEAPGAPGKTDGKPTSP